MTDSGRAVFPSPRPFQERAHQALRTGRGAGHKNQMVMAPTGAGKTYLGMRIAHEALVRGKRVIFVCDRTTLINQTSATADRYGLTSHSILQASHPRLNRQLAFQIASAQTLARRGWLEADVIIIDEAHTQMKIWTEHIVSTGASVIGLSATPFSPGLGLLFSNLINAATMHELTSLATPQVLVPMKPYTCTPADMRGAETAGGEWTDRACEQRGIGVVGDVVSEWIKFGDNRKTIVFGSTIRHCEELCRQFSRIKVCAGLFTSRTTPEERQALLKEYVKPDSTLRVLISVEALAKGFDVPDVGCIVDCRPLRKSLSTAMQMWGRGMRASPETDKVDCILLDHTGNIVRFLDDFTNVYFNGLPSLDGGEKLDSTVRQDQDEREVKSCPSCGFTPMAKQCMACGHEHQRISLEEVRQGEMQPVMLGKRKLADDPFDLYRQCATYARTYSKPENQKGRAFHLYREMTGGRKPDREWERIFESVEASPISRHVFNKIRSMNIARGSKHRDQ